MLSVQQVVIATLVCAAVTFATRVFPFVFFSRWRMPESILFIQRYIPPMTMVILVIYSVKDLDWANITMGGVTIISVLVTALLHIWRGNALISIFSGTALYMVLIRLV